MIQNVKTCRPSLPCYLRVTLKCQTIHTVLHTGEGDREGRLKEREGKRESRKGIGHHHFGGKVMPMATSNLSLTRQKPQTGFVTAADQSASNLI